MKTPVMVLCEACHDKMTNVFIFEPVNEIWEKRQCSMCGRNIYTLRYKYERISERYRPRREPRQKDTRAQWQPPFREWEQEQFED